MTDAATTTTTSTLFTPLRWRDLTLPNRILVSPMCQYSAHEGAATDWHLAHWAQLTISGAGALFIEATGVEPEGRITPRCLGLWDDRTEQALGDALARARAQTFRMPVVIQLAHAGRKASSAIPWEGGQLLPLDRGGWITSAPSAVPHAEGERAPQALDAAGLVRVRDAFVQAARRADRVGIDGIELHAAHGYLLHQFLSPVANRRTDAYGGSLEHRMRFPLEIFDAVRAVWPAHKPLGVRVSASDWLEASGTPCWTLDDTLAFAHALKARGCDWIDVSSGGISPHQKIAIGPGYQVPFARAVKHATGVSTVAVGMITDPQQAEHIVLEGDADAVALARAMLYDPRWPWHAAAHLGGTVHGTPQYSRSLPRDAQHIFGDLRVGQR